LENQEKYRQKAMLGKVSDIELLVAKIIVLGNENSGFREVIKVKQL
jgi:hypothetical protein